MRLTVFAAFVTLCSSILQAQSFENIRATSQGNKVIISYDLNALRVDDSFSVEIYGSHDNYVNPLKIVSGDIGYNVKSGPNKKVEWNVESELKTFKGDITFELRGKPVILKLLFKPTTGTVKKGNSTTIEWLGGVQSNQAKIFLFQGEKMISTIAETPNNGTAQWKVPKDLKSGDGYYYRLTSGTESVNSATFNIKGKIPLLLKLSPLIIGGAVIGLMGGGGGGENPPATPSSLPTPPNPGG